MSTKTAVEWRIKMKDIKYFGSYVMRYLQKQRKTLILLGILFICNIVLQVIAPQVLSSFIDAAKSVKPLGFISILVLAYLVTILLKMVAGVGETYFAKKFGWKITNSFRRDVLEHFIKIDMEHHEKWTSGEMITRLDEDVEGLFTYFYMLIFKLVGSLLLMSGILIVLGMKNLIIAGALLVFCIITIWVFKAIQDYGMKLYVKRSAAISKLNGIMKEKVDNAIEIRTNNADEYSLHSLNAAMKTRFKDSLPGGMMYSKLWSASTILDSLGTILSLCIAIVLWDKGLISLGTVYLIHTYTELIYNPLQEFRSILRGLQEAKAGLIRVREMLNIKSTIIEGDYEISGKNITLTVRDLCFGYTENSKVLNKISFELKPGEKIGIMGETGCGKTTLARLLARLYEYNQGEILLDGINIREIKLNSLRGTIAYCTQEVQFLHGTLRDNITLYNDSISDQDVLAAIEQMGLFEWFKKFPEGLDTYLEMGENNVSAGEAQLVSIIRLFLRDPAIVILDEISSRLDYETEQRVLAALDVLTSGRTVITIAHRLSALRWTDNIMILNDGKIVEYGRKEELEKDIQGWFYSLSKAMAREKEDGINEEVKVS